MERESYSFEVPITYEMLPKFYSHSHIIRHLVGECRSLKKIQESLVINKSQVVNSKVTQGNVHAYSTKKTKYVVHFKLGNKAIKTIANKHALKVTVDKSANMVNQVATSAHGNAAPPSVLQNSTLHEENIDTTVDAHSLAQFPVVSTNTTIKNVWLVIL